MPIFEYACRACGREFEQLVRAGDVPACPACQGRDLDKLHSLASINTAERHKANVARARRAGSKLRRDQAMADLDEIREHYGPDAVRKTTN